MVFSVEISMKDRYVPYFLSMLRKMENYGQNGMSREVAFFADGDGDFQPKFRHNVDFDIMEPLRDNLGTVLYDAVYGENRMKRRDITLGEMQDECKRHGDCGKCNVKTLCVHYLDKPYTSIDLTDPPRFTEAQMALLKALYASGVVKIVFGANNDLLRCLDAEYNMTAGLFWEKIGLPREELDLSELLGKDGAEC